MRPEGVELVLPRHIGESEARHFLDRHRVWAYQKLEDIRKRSGKLKQSCLPLIGGASVPFQGVERELVVVEGGRRKVHRRLDGAFEISIPEASLEEEALEIRHALYAWVRVWMRAEVASLIDRFSPLEGLEPRGVRIKAMKTRWGSLGPKNDMNLNWLLAFTPPEVLAYVVIHEICHIRFRNHSKAYWDLVTRHDPMWPERRAWLKQHGTALLHRFG